MVRKLLLGLVVIGFLLWIAAMQRPVPPVVDADCAAPSFTLSAETVVAARPLAYTIVGPPGREYALGVNTTTFTGGPGDWRPVARAGYENDVIVAAEPAPMPERCTRSGLFALPIRPGRHPVTLYELAAAGPVPVARQEIEVTER